MILIFTTISLFIGFTLATVAGHLAQTPTSWTERGPDGRFIVGCGDDDGNEIPCDIEPPTTEPCE